MSCHCKEKRGSFITGILLVGVGLVFLLDEMGVLPGMDRSWPLLLIVVGIAFLLASRKEKDPEEPDQM